MFIGKLALHQLEQFEDALQKRYDLQRELRFPFGRQEGWGYRYAHKKSLLCYLFLKRVGLPARYPLMTKVHLRLKQFLLNCSRRCKGSGRSAIPVASKGDGCIRKLEQSKI